MEEDFSTKAIRLERTTGRHSAWRACSLSCNGWRPELGVNRKASIGNGTFENVQVKHPYRDGISQAEDVLVFEGNAKENGMRPGFMTREHWETWRRRCAVLA